MTTPKEALEFIQYRRKQIAELRPWTSEFDMRLVSVSAVDTQNGSPKAGDMIARNPKNHADQWLVAAAYFADNFEPVASLQGEDAVERVAQTIREYCIGVSPASIQLSHGVERIYYAGLPVLELARAILATALLPDEAVVRADEREKCAAWHDDQSRIEMDSLHCGDNTSTIAAARRRADWHDKAASAIRSGGGE